MDFIRKYDIELEKEQYYAGELLRGWVVIENAENLRITGVQVFLRGKAHVEWRITRGGERRTVKEDQYFVDEKSVVWGKAAENGDEAATSILDRGEHRMPFEFQLPGQCLPCSFESRIGTIRYYLRVIVDIPYASQPQGLKYFTVIGQQIDCINARYMEPLSVSRQLATKCALCSCTSGPLSLDACLERTAYCCTENIRLKCDVTNGTDQDVTLTCRLIQNVEYRINKGPLGLNKDITHHVLEYRSSVISPHSVKSFHDLDRDLQVPVMPPTLTDVCRVIEIFYTLRVFVHMEKSGKDLLLEFPFTVATVPYRDAGVQLGEITYEPADDHVEGGIYISPEFQLGQVYDGAADVMEDVILYRPVYVCSVPISAAADLGNGHSPTAKGVASDRHDGHTPSPALSRAVISSASVEQTNGCSPVIKVKKKLLQNSSGQTHINEPAGAPLPATNSTNHAAPIIPTEPELAPNAVAASDASPKSSSPPVALTSVTSSSTAAVTSQAVTCSSVEARQSNCLNSSSTSSRKAVVTGSDVTSHVIRDATGSTNTTEESTSCPAVIRT